MMDKKQYFLELIKGSILKFQLRRKDVNYDKSSKNKLNDGNYVELLDHTTGLKDVYVLEIFYNSNDMKCSFYISPATYHDPMGKLLFDKYITNSNVGKNQNNDVLTVPNIEFSKEEFGTLKELFDGEYATRKIIYAKELEDSKSSFFESWKNKVL